MACHSSALSATGSLLSPLSFYVGPFYFIFCLQREIETIGGGRENKYILHLDIFLTQTAKARSWFRKMQWKGPREIPPVDFSVFRRWWDNPEQTQAALLLDALVAFPLRFRNILI